MNFMTITCQKKFFRTVLLRLMTIVMALFITTALGEISEGSSGENPISSRETKDDFKSNSLSGKALLSFKAQRSLVSFKSFKLSRSKLNTSQTELIRRGWTNSDDTLVWTPGGVDPYIEIPIVWEKGLVDSKITTFNYLQFDYQELYPDNPSKFFFEMVLDPVNLIEKDPKKAPKKEVLVAGGYKALHDLEIEENQDITATDMTPKDFWYLSKRLLRLPFDKNWVFAQSGKSATFQRRFNKNLKSIESMDLFLSRTIDISQVKLTLRVGWGGLLKKEDIILWENIPVREINKIKGLQFLKIGLKDLVRQRYKDKQNVTLKEVVVFIPGDSDQLAPTHPLENIRFQKTTNSYQKEDWLLPASTHTLSQGRKRFELNTWKMINATGRQPKIKSMRLFISPHNKHAYSGVRFDGARVNQMVHIQQLKFLNTGEQLNQRWGGRFLTHTPDKEFVEWSHVKSYFPFYNIDYKKQYKSGRDRLADISVHSNKGALYRIDETPELLTADLQFYSRDGSFSVKFRSFHASDKDREVTIEWELEGALKLQLEKNFLHPLKGNITRFHLRKGETPVLKIELKDKSLLEKLGRVSGRIVIKSISARDLSEEESSQNNRLEVLFIESPDKEKLAEKERRSINESKHLPSEQIEDSGKTTTRLNKSGVVIQAQTPIRHWRPVTDGLLIQGKGQWVDIGWPVQASLDKDTLFFLGVSRGAEFIHSLEIVPTSQGQRLPPVLGVPNHSVRLIAGTTKIENLHVRMKLRGGPYEISIEEMSLFKPIVLARKKAFNFPTLVWGETPLIPEKTRFDPKTNSFIKPGNLKAIVSSENSDHPKLSWTTKINRRLSWIRGLKINYQVPLAFHGNNPCWLHLTLVGSNSKTDQKVCFDNANGQVFLPADLLFQKFEMTLNENLNFIDWTIRLDPRKPMAKIPLAVNLGMTLDGVDIQTIHNDLKRQPVFSWNEEKVYPSYSGNKLFERLSDENGWSDFQLFNFSMASDKSLPTLNEEHPYLQTKTIAFEGGRRQLSKEEKLQAEKDVEGEVFGESTRGLFESTLFKIFSVLLLLWLIFNNTTRSKLKSSGKQIVQKIFQPKVFLNRAVGLIAIGPGFWAIGRFTGSEVESIGISALFVLLTGVAYHELRWFLMKNSTTPDWTHKIISGKDGKIPVFFYFMAMMVFGWSTWQLGQLAYGPHPAMLLIPIIFLVYFYIPWLPSWFQRATFWLPQSRKYSVATMVSLATAFYIFGNLWVWSEIFMSFGGLVLVSLWGHWAQKNHTKLEHHWPGLARQVYAEKGNLYLVGFLLTMGTGALCLLTDFDALAEHTVNVSLFMLVTALYLRARSIYNQRPNPMPHKPS
jgi:hypothetical protein